MEEEQNVPSNSLDKSPQSIANEKPTVPDVPELASSPSNTLVAASSTPKSGQFTKVRNQISTVLRPRESVMADLRDISLVGGMYCLVFFAARDRFLTTLIASIFSAPGLAQDNITQMGNLLLATFPLCIGTAIVTAGYIGQFRFIRKIELQWNPLMGLLFAFAILWICTWIGALLGIGGVGNAELTRLIDGPFYINCHSTGGTAVPQTAQNCTFVNASDLYGIGLFLYYLFAFVTIFWSTYGFGTFAAALVLGVYLSWAIFYKLASHLRL